MLSCDGGSEVSPCWMTVTQHASGLTRVCRSMLKMIPAVSTLTVKGFSTKLHAGADISSCCQLTLSLTFDQERQKLEFHGVHSLVVEDAEVNSSICTDGVPQGQAEVNFRPIQLVGLRLLGWE